MKNSISILAGWIAMISATLGAIFCIGGIVLVWHYQPAFTENARAWVSLSRESLTTTKEGLSVLDEVLSSAEASIDVLDKTVDDLSNSFHTTQPVLESIGKVIGTDMVQVVQDTQKSLTSAQSGARLIDDTLGLISSIPLIGSNYKPTTPLYSSISGIAKSLDGLPKTFIQVQDGFDTAASNMAAMGDNLVQIKGDISKTKARLQETHKIIDQYQTYYKEIDTTISSLEEGLPGWIGGLAVALTVILIWIFLTQVSIFLIGYDKIKGEQAKTNP